MSQIQKYRPVFSLDSLTILQSLLESLPLEIRDKRENRKVIQYLDDFIYKIDSGQKAPQYALVPIKKSSVDILELDIAASASKRAAKTQEELDAEFDAIDFTEFNKVIL